MPTFDAAAEQSKMHGVPGGCSHKTSLQLTLLSELQHVGCDTARLLRLGGHKVIEGDADKWEGTEGKQDNTHNDSARCDNYEM